MLLLSFLLCRPAMSAEPTLDLSTLHNPVWSTKDNLRDPSVLKTKTGYLLFYTRAKPGVGAWTSNQNWSVACVTTTDFVHFENDHDVSPLGHASPGDVIFWHGRYILPYQSYPERPVELQFSESPDLLTWSEPKSFLTEALQLPWNQDHRVIDPSFIVDGDTLHCFFIGSAYVTDSTGKKIRSNLMGHAITKDPDLKQWKILTPDQPLIGASPNAPDGVENLMVFKTGTFWTMIYSEGLVHQHLARATSPDLIIWKLAGDIHLPIQTWMAHRYGAPFVWRENFGWVMILMGENAQTRTSFGLLSSPDGENWTIRPE